MGRAHPVSQGLPRSGAVRRIDAEQIGHQPPTLVVIRSPLRTTTRGQ
jgi:hypothetical protein